MPKGISLIDGDFAIKILSWYLWGQEKAPKPEELADTKWIDRKGNIELEYSTVELLEKAGEFVNAKDFRLFEVFFSGKTSKKNSLNNGNKQLTANQCEKFEDGKYYLTQDQFAELFYNDANDKTKEKAKKATTKVYLYNRALLDEDFAKVAFLFGSIAVGLDTDKIRYVLDENLNPICVENVKYKFDVGDFDYESNSTIANIVNWVLKQTTDPSNIGKKVLLKPIIDMTPKKDGTPMEDATINVGTIGQLDYYLMGSLENVQIPTNSIDAEIQISKLVMEALAYYFEYKDIKKSGVINYLDENGKLVIYDASQSNIIIGTHAKNFDFADNVEIKLNKNTKFSIPLAIFNHYKDRIPNGITYIGGAGADIIAGTKYDDILYGHDRDGKNDDGAKDVLVGDEGSDRLYGGQGEDTLIGSFSQSVDDDTADELYGGDGYDTYYAGNKDIINDLDGAGKVFFDNNLLIGGQYDKDRGVYIDINNANITYSLDEPINTLTVNKIENGKAKTLTIYNFHKNNSSLDITLLDPGEIGISISDNQTNEGDSGKKSLDFNISLQGSIEKGEFLILGIGDKKYLFGDPSEEYIKKYNLNLAQYERGNTYTYTWEGNTIKQEDREFDVTPIIIQTSDKLKAKILKHGIGKIIDDDEDDSPNDTFPDMTPASTKTSPIVIDLNGDGVKTISRKNGKTYFDLDNNKFAENTSWIDKNDGILVNKTLIANSITNGSELFGNHTLLRDGGLANNGFEALKEFDENKDGVINELDLWGYESLAIWQDANQNAKLDDNELKSLKELGIKEINLNYTNSNFIDENGNEHRQTSNITFTNGNTTTISDVWLDTFTADTRYVGEKIVLSAEIEALPQIYAFGEVLNLHQAMAKDKVLQTMVQNYIVSDKAKQNEMINDIIYRWANSDQIDPNARDPKKIYSHVMDARQLVALEHLTGKGYLGIWCWGEHDPNPHGQAAPLLIDEFNKFVKYVQAQISAQSEFKDLFAGILPLQWEKNQTGDLSMAFKTLKDRIADLLPNVDYADISADNIIRARELINTAKNLGTYNTKYQSVFETIEAGWLSEIENLKFVINSVEGTAGNDNLSGDNKDNIIIGGRGDDTLFGGAGNDMYYFDILFGKDRVYDSAGVDGIVFSKNIKPENIELTRNKTSIYITRLDDNKAKTNDVIQIDNFFEYNGDIGNGAIEKIIFQNGTQWDINKIIEILAPQPTQGNDNLYGDMKDNIISGLGGDDIIYGGNGNDTINGNDGNDELHGDDGNDQLFGGDGNDTLYGENGNDTLIGGMGSDNLQGGDGNDTLNGGLGNDTLNGGYGDDTYIFNKGDGADTITDYGGNNILKLGAGLDKKDLIVSHNSNGYILLSFKNNASDSITLTSPNIQVVEFANGDKMNIDEIKKLSLIGDDTDNTIYGYNGENNTLIGNGGNDTLYGNTGNDTLIGGKGNDTLNGSYGDDIYIFNKGDGADTITDYGGNNILKLGLGLDKKDSIISQNSKGYILLSFKGNANDSIIFNQNIQTIEFANGDKINIDEIKKLSLIGDDADNTIYGYYNENNTLIGNGGNDTLYGNTGNDTLIGGKGNDTLNGSYGDDIYIFNKGDGNDIIADTGGINTLQFGEGISRGDLEFNVINLGSALKISFKNNSNDSIVINQANVENIKFASGEILKLSDIFNSIKIIGTEGDDVIHATINAPHIIEGGNGNDNIRGNNYTKSINGGAGNDTLNGGYGDDTYIFNKGDGSDTIIDYGGNNILKLGVGLGKKDLIVSQNSNGYILLSFKNNASDSITLTSPNIQVVEFANGDKMNIDEIKKLSLIGDDTDNTIYGYNGENNTLIGNKGNDTLNGGYGDDTYIFNKGDGADTITDYGGNNILKLGAGLDKKDLIVSHNSNGYILLSFKNNASDSITLTSPNIQVVEFANGDKMNIDEIKKLSLIGDDTDNTIYGYYNENNTLIGNGGNDTIRGDNGNDILIGGKGDDILHGGYGDDTYIFNKGDGNDIIVDYGGINTLQFGEGISRNDLEFNTTNLGSDLKISFKNSPNDSIILNQSSVKNIRFASGEILNLNDINAIKITGTEGGDVIRAGINIPHIIEGGNGNDDIRGNDYTKSISGGKGNDKLYGGSGDNIYIFNKGDGADIIYDMAGKDEIQFKEGVAPNDINFKRELDKLIISIKSNDDSITIQNFFSINPEIGNNTVRTITFSDGTVYDFNKILELTPLSPTDKDDKFYLTDGNDTFDAGLGNDEIWSGNGDDIINGNEGNDVLYGNDGNDTLNGGNGNDTLYGGNGNDTITGGEGDDILYGGFGDDTYIFNKGDGNDIITDDEGVDTIKFGKGILKEDLIISRSNAYNIIVQFKNNPGDKITINRVDRGNIEKFEFSDGTIMNLNDIKAKSIIGTQNDDIIYGYDEKDNILKGGSGNDTLIGGSRNDIIEGDEGNDVLRGNSGNDTLIGGSGNDVLCGGYGDDTYIFNKGDGNDIIDDDQGDDTIKFGEGISKEDLIISRRNAYNTIVRFKNNPGDTITLNNLTYIDLNNLTYIERFEFADGTFMNLNDIKTKSLVGTQDDDVIYGYDGDNILKGGGGNDSLIGGKGNDIIEGDEGDDWLFGNHGNDTLTGGSGNDILKGSDGDDIYIFNKGDGNDTIYDENGNDTIKFNDFNADDITLKREFKNLIISSKISKDVITINDFFRAYNGYDYAIENIIFKDGSIWDYKAILDNSAIKATEGDDKICLGNGDDNFNALGGDDEIYGEGGNDTIAGGDGNDKLDGGEGDDILYGNKGDDILSGGNGNDTLNGGDGDDKLYGWDGDDTIVGENGNDILNGGNGSDTLNGGAGNDIINGDEGNDTLIGGKDSDILNGGYGDDAYIFNRGDGKDTITDNQGTDTVKFGEGISKEDIIVKRVARMNDYTKQKEYSDIVILFKNSPNDSITLRDVTHGNSINENNVIETFEFSNGDKLSFEDIKKLSLIGTDNSENIIGYIHSNNIIKGGGGDDKLYGQGWNDTMYGGDGNDLIEGGSGNDILIGDKGNDTLKGGIGDDILIGGAGNDTLNGGADNDTYVYNKGDGNDIIEEWGGIDTIKFGEGIQKKDLIISRDISKNSYYLSNVKDIIIKFKYNETDSITLKNVINANKTGIYSAIENFEFANGEKLSFEDIKQLSLVGTDEGETINGFEDSNNTLIGNGGNDWLYGDKKNDILIGGEGDDHLRGNEGDDTYIYNIGDGNDTIHDYEGEDIIKFGKGINKEDIIVTKGEVKYDSYTRSSYQDLVISLKGKQGGISLEHIISRDNGIYEKYSHKTLVFENGDKLSFDDILKLSLIGNDENNDIYGYSHRDNILEGNGGDDALYGNIGNDTLIGGKGNDGLYGNGGDDTYVYNKGDGVDYIYDIEGNDTLKFGKGIKKEDLVVSVSKNKEKLSQYDDTHRVMYIKIGFKNNDTDAVFLRGNKDLAIENFEFENGDRLSFEDIKKLALTGDDTNNLLYGYDDINNVMNGLGGDDEIQGGELNDTIYGGTGNDTISGDKGDDTIYGGEGNDTINGGSGDDIIEGGKGDDVIKGGWGDDIYIFNKGDGNDTIADYEGTDTLQLGEGITKDDIIAKHTPQGTIIKFKNSKNDSISFGHFGIDRIKFANGEELSSEDIEKLELIGTDEADTIFGNSDQDNLIIGGKGDDILYGSYSGNNTFVYNQGDGADTIYAGTHENKIKFGQGINKEDLIVERCVNTDARDYDNLKISFRNSASDSIMLTYIIKDNINAQEIQTFEFANGDKLGFDDIKKLSLIGTDKNDELRGYNDMDNEIKGGNGDDILIGGNGVNNILEGGSGNDTLRGCYDSYGNPGISMNGKNTFVFSRGDGNDMVENFKDNDLIKFKDIGSNEVKFNLNLVDNSLLISDKLSNSSVLIKNYDVRTNLNFQFKDGKILGSDFISGQVKPIDGGNTMVGGKEDNVFIYDGGAKTIMDLGGYDKVIYKNPVKRVRYDFGKNGSSDLKLIITPADPNAKNDILEVKGFFSNRDNVIEEFHIGKYLNIKAADIYKAFGKTYIASAKPTALAMDAKLDIDNETQISPLSKSSSDGSNSKSGWNMVLGSGDKNELKAIVSKYCDDSNLNTPDLNSNLSVSNAMDLNSAPGVIQEEALKDNAFLSQDTVNKIIEQLNIYADNSEALEFNQRDIRKDDMQVYMS